VTIQELQREYFVKSAPLAIQNRVIIASLFKYSRIIWFQARKAFKRN